MFETVKPTHGPTLYKVERTLSRKNLVFFMRSQDNGSHFDRTLRDETYATLAKWKTGLEVSVAGSEFRSIPNPHFATVRQIAWELEEALRSIPGGPQLPPPEAAAEWLSNPPDQYRLGPEKQTIQLRVVPEMEPIRGDKKLHVALNPKRSLADD